MAKNQAKQEPAAEEPEVWVGDEAADFDEAANDAVVPQRAETDMRHKIEDLIESRRLRKQLGDYEMLDLDDDEKPRPARKTIH